MRFLLLLFFRFFFSNSDISYVLINIYQTQTHTSLFFTPHPRKYCTSYVLLVHLEGLHFDELLKADLATTLTADAAHLDAAEGGGVVGGHVVVHPDVAGLHLLGHPVALALRVAGPDGAAEPVVRVVGAGHGLLDGLVLEDGDDRPELFLYDDK